MKRKLFEEVEGEENKVPTTSQGDSEKPEVTDQKSNSSEILQKLIDLMKNDYTSFVRELSKITSDNNLFPKLKNLILGGVKDGESVDEKFSISGEYDQSVAGLIPTQNEIDRNKSLAFPVTYPIEYEKIGVSKEDAKVQIGDILKGVPVRINKMPIVVFDYSGKTYILDGHHRWSSVHALNKEGQIKAIKLTSTKGIDPLNALRAIQLSIAVSVGKVPTAKAGTNETNILLSSSNSFTQTYLEESMSDGFVGIYKEFKDKEASKEKTISFIMDNIKTMQSTGFLKGAPTREVMPQTDGTDDLKANQDLWKNPLKSGQINVLPKYGIVEPSSVQKESRVVKTFESFVKWNKKK
jgi:hypothetical protein